LQCSTTILRTRFIAGNGSPGAGENSTWLLRLLLDPVRLRDDTKKSNHAIEPTASRRAIPAIHDFGSSTRSDTRPRAGQLLFFSLRPMESPGSRFSMSSRTIRQSIGAAGVIASLAFVGMQIRQSNIQARAAAYQTIGIATSEFHRSFDARL